MGGMLAGVNVTYFPLFRVFLVLLATQSALN